MNNRRWLVLGFVFLGILVSYVDRGNLSVANLSIAQELHLTPAVMGVLLSAFFWTYAVWQIPAGVLVDRFGVRGTYALAFTIWSLSSASIALSTGAGDIKISRLMLGFAEAVAPVASLAVIRASFPPRENGLPTSIYMTGQTLGPAIGSLLGTALIASFGWRVLFAGTGLAALLWVPCWLAVAPQVENRKTSLLTGWGAILLNPTLWTMAICVFFFSYYWYFVLTWVPAYLMSARGFSNVAMGRIFAVPFGFMALTNLLSGWLADRLLKKAVSPFAVRFRFAAGGLVGAASILFLNVLPSNALAIPVLILSVCSFGILSASFWTLAQNVAPPEKVGRVIGFLNTISQVGGVAAPLITGYTLGPTKNFTTAIAIAGVCPLIALVPLLITRQGFDQLRDVLHLDSASASLAAANPPAR
jgi:MFS family permease